VAGAIDRAIAEVARRHGGHITRRQLLELGLKASEIDYRIQVGRLLRVYRGVFAVGRLPTRPEDEAAGALLACGRDSALSHTTAETLYGLQPVWRRPFEITIRGDRQPDGIRIHRSTAITSEDVRRHNGLWVTSPAWTVVDVAPRLTDKRLTRVINELRFAKDVRLELAELQDAVERRPRHPGARRVRPFIADDTGPTRSALEDMLRRFLTHFDFTGYQLNYPIGRYQADVFFIAEQTIFEVDGWEFHRTKEAFEHDRFRDAWILAEYGIPTVRITYDRLERLAAAEARRLQRILQDRRNQLTHLPPARRA
jgi:very-short-patch-repair endonuclease